MHIPAARVVFTEEDRAEVAAGAAGILACGALTLGEHTSGFEGEFATAHERPYAVATSSGTAALEIILRCLDVSGAEVVVPTNTFAATAFAVLRAGGRPVFADVGAGTFALTPESVEPWLGEATKAVVLVHIGGVVPAGARELRALCDARGVALVEDAAHAHGATLDGAYAGSFGVAGAFSFYPTKVVTSGEGGMIVTADERIRDEARIYRDQGKAGFLGNMHIRPGYAWRMSELHALTGRVHLRHLPEFLCVRGRVAARYDTALESFDGIVRIPPSPGAVSNYYKYLVMLPPGIDRGRLKRELRDRYGVTLSGEVYELPLHRQPVFEAYARGTLPVAEQICARHICLPVHSDMSDAEADHVTTSLRAVLDASIPNG
jgi:dTDP-4-amino-4,6-dideoxygalactose transaminase